MAASDAANLLHKYFTTYTQSLDNIFISHEAAKHTTKSTNTTHNNKSQTVKIKKN